jgi:hypothetical protein
MPYAANMSPPRTNTPAYSSPISNTNLLPPLVRRIRAKILDSARSGDIAALIRPIEWNELIPLFDHGAKSPHHMVPGSDPIAFLKSLSFDQRGDEILALLITVFESPFCHMRLGTSLSYVWPAFAFIPDAPEDEEKLRRLRYLRFADLDKLGADGKPLYYRANIGADGTWHYFWAGA